MKNQLTIYTGHFGSGKTELSLNDIQSKKREGINSILVDMDIVNPFFRSSELTDLLVTKNIEVIAPNFAHTNMDLPSLSADVAKAFYQKETHSVLDIGGDDQGARVLGVYKDQIDDCTYDLLFVFNTRRPETDTLEKLMAMMTSIEAKSGLHITKTVANSNLGDLTDESVVREGIEMGIKLYQETGIELAYVAVEENLFGEICESLTKGAYEIDVIYKPIKRYMNQWRGRA